jgi:hypothetical protein
MKTKFGFERSHRSSRGAKSGAPSPTIPMAAKPAWGPTYPVNGRRQCRGPCAPACLRLGNASRQRVRIDPFRYAGCPSETSGPHREGHSCPALGIRGGREGMLKCLRENRCHLKLHCLITGSTCSSSHRASPSPTPSPKDSSSSEARPGSRRAKRELDTRSGVREDPKSR